MRAAKQDVVGRSLVPVLVPILVLAILGGSALLSAGPAAAATKAPVPRGGQWCGVASSGGTVRMEVSRDGRWLLSLDIQTLDGAVSSSESSLRKTQIVIGKFIVRGGRAGRSGSSGRCTRVPCRGNESPRGGATTIRGTFKTDESVRGTFTAVIERDNTRGSGSTSRRLTGNFIAWPAGVAPCP